MDELEDLQAGTLGNDLSVFLQSRKAGTAAFFMPGMI